MAKRAPCHVDIVNSLPTVAAAAVLVVLFSISVYAQSGAPSAPRGSASGSGSVQKSDDGFWSTWPPPALAYSDSEWSAHWFLKELGCEQGFMAFVTRLFFHPVGFIIFVALMLMLAALFADLKLAKRDLKFDLGSGVLAASVLLAVFQWHASLEQDAMQRYEVEISNANNAETYKPVAMMLPHFYKGSDPAPERFVYIHLDNLEYALERYREGFASATTTARAVMTFAVHCHEEVFRNQARKQLSGYSPLVRRVAKAVIDRS